MNFNKILIFQCLCLLAFNNYLLSQDDHPLPYKESGENQYEYSIKIKPDLPKYIFTVTAPIEPMFNIRAVIKVEVRREGRDRIVQKLKLPKDLIEDFYPEHCVAMDMNFDGYLDFLLISHGGSAGVAYAVWLYDPKTRKFNLDRDFKDIYNPVPDPLTKTITSSFSEGWRYNRRDTYKYDKSKLVLICSTENEFSESINRHIITTTLFESSKQISVKVDTLSEEK
jgi:hypothetical protein